MKRHCSVLTAIQAKEIFKLHENHDLKPALVAKVYKVNEKTIRDIWNRRSWAQCTCNEKNIRRNKQPKASAIETQLMLWDLGFNVLLEKEDPFAEDWH